MVSTLLVLACMGAACLSNQAGACEQLVFRLMVWRTLGRGMRSILLYVEWSLRFALGSTFLCRCTGGAVLQCAIWMVRWDFIAVCVVRMAIF